jgi:hypothetical protein
MRKSTTHFIIQEDYLRILDYVSAIKSSLKAKFKNIKAPHFRGHDMSDLIKEDLKNQTIYSGMRAVLTYRLFRRLAASGLKPKRIISRYENQVIDKALIAGARSAFPETTIVGSQIFLPSPNCLNYFPSQSEVDSKMTPDVLLAISKHQCEVAQEFTKSIQCYPAAALMYLHIFDDSYNELVDTKTERQSVVVLLPSDIRESVEILHMLANVKTFDDKENIVMIKIHPDVADDELINVYGKSAWSKCFNITHDSLAKVLCQARIVIGSNTSSIVAAAAMGIPVIVLARQVVLSQNMFASARMKIATECFTAEELTVAVDKLLNLSPAESRKYKELSQSVRDLFFTPMNEETMSPFLLSVNH